jgi:dephospho-CoA kinase
MKKTIVGLLGETGSGKDTVAEYLKEEYGAKLMRFADPMKETLSIYFDKLSKADQSWLYLVFKERFGEDVLSRAMAKRVEDEKSSLIVINGLRMPSDYDFVKKYPDSYVLYITLDQKIRWERVASRGEKTDDKISFKKFQELDRQETEVHISEVGAKADKKINNDKDLNYLLSEVDKYMTEVGVSRNFKEVNEEHTVVGDIPKFD